LETQRKIEEEKIRIDELNDKLSQEKEHQR
jgi:hypothetical protein